MGSIRTISLFFGTETQTDPKPVASQSGSPPVWILAVIGSSEVSYFAKTAVRSCAKAAQTRRMATNEGDRNDKILNWIRHHLAAAFAGGPASDHGGKLSCCAAGHHDHQ